VPIGRPIPNVQLYILDSYRQLCPIGAMGELYIDGVGLARGYWNRPELTTERFVANPFSADPESRLYRTGDLARYRADGNLEYLGRADDQVKIRGYRIELGEIEAALRQCDGVSEAVVVVHPDASGEARLLAYIADAQNDPDYARAVREQLKQRLPAYMVPAAIVSVRTIPLSPNGKVDRKALPLPDASSLEPSAEYVAPRTELEQTLAGMWADLLRVDRVGIHDNFFDLGGHSLLATQVVSRVRNELDVEMQLKILFNARTVSQLAEQIETLRWVRRGGEKSLINDSWEEIRV
jgi:acyl carrier protein